MLAKEYHLTPNYVLDEMTIAEVNAFLRHIKWVNGDDKLPEPPMDPGKVEINLGPCEARDGKRTFRG